MKTIPVTTSQKVTIEYVLAPLGQRISAFLLDFVMVWGFIIILFFLALLIFTPTGQSGWLYLFVTLMPIFMFYTLITELLMNGQTVGKKILGLKIIKPNGQEPVLSDYLIRWVFRLVDIWFTGGFVASMLISSTGNNQRLGEILSDTVVVQIRTNYHVSLQSLLSLSNREVYVPAYPAVRKFSEEEMLLIKTVLHRIDKFPNKAHKDLLRETSFKAASVIGLEKPPYNQREFLRTLIADYVALTR